MQRQRLLADILRRTIPWPPQDVPSSSDQQDETRRRINHLQEFILGAVQGLTEFLSISSSGHLVLLQRVFGLKEDVLASDIAVHLATMIAVLAVFWKDVLGILRNPFAKLS